MQRRDFVTLLGAAAAWPLAARAQETDRVRRIGALMSMPADDPEGQARRLAPEVILASTSPSVAALQQASRTVPIVFAAVTDPVGQGFVSSLQRPGGNAIGFALYEYGIGAKWLEMLKEIH